MKKTLKVDVGCTPEELAGYFCEMDDGEQARFFNSIALLSDLWKSPFCFQLESITNNSTLLNKGRRVMEQIGEYAYKKP